MSRVFDRVPDAQIERGDWKQDKFLRELAQTARECNIVRMKEEYRRILGLCVMLEEAEAALDHAQQQIAALETVNSEQDKRIDELTREAQGLRLTVGRMKKRNKGGKDDA